MLKKKKKTFVARDMRGWMTDEVLAIKRKKRKSEKMWRKLN